MRRILSIQDILVIILVSALFAQVSWWVLLTQQAARSLLREEIASSLEQGQQITISDLPATLMLPLITYMPFWLVTFTLVRIFSNLEKERNRIRI
jgi:hypothetical protein